MAEMAPEELVVRAAVEGDVPLVLALIKELAEYERMADQVVATEADVHRALFGATPWAETVIAVLGETPVGFALFFHSFSTFLAKPGLYLEDLYVKPEFRGLGFGRRLLVHLPQVARTRGCGRFEWSVLDWNEPAIRSYRRAGAVPMDDWTVYRLSGEALHRLASEGSEDCCRTPINRWSTSRSGTTASGRRSMTSGTTDAVAIRWASPVHWCA